MPFETSESPPSLPWWKKAIALFALVLVTILATIASMVGKGALSKAALKKDQDVDAARRQREVDLVNAAAKAKVEAVNAKADFNLANATASHKERVTKIEEEARRESPADLDALAADLRKSILR